MSRGILETFWWRAIVVGIIYGGRRPLLLAIEMCVAIWKVHSLHGIYAVRGLRVSL